MIVLAVENGVESADGVFERDQLAQVTGENLGHLEGLRQEPDERKKEKKRKKERKKEKKKERKKEGKKEKKERKRVERVREGKRFDQHCTVEKMNNGGIVWRKSQE